MSEEIEISESNKWILRLLMGGFVLVIMIFGFAGGFKNQSYNNMLKKQYYGIITDKFYDKANHNTPTLRLASGYKFGLPDKYYNQIQVSDSLYKDYNSIYTYIVRNQNIIMKIDRLNSIYYTTPPFTNE